MKERTEVNPAQNLALALCGTNFRNQVLTEAGVFCGIIDKKRLKPQSHDHRFQALRGGQGIRTLAPFHRPSAFRVRPLEPLG